MRSGTVSFLGAPSPFGNLFPAVLGIADAVYSAHFFAAYDIKMLAAGSRIEETVSRYKKRAARKDRSLVR